MATTRKAHAKWEGDLLSGKGSVRPDTGAFSEVAVTWKNRSGDAEGKSSPEELLAAAHAACFSMALSNGLAKAGMTPVSVQTTAAATFDKVGDGFKVTQMVLHVKAKVQKADAAKFQELAKTTGETGCPISKVMAGNVPIQVVAELL